MSCTNETTARSIDGCEPRLVVFDTNVIESRYLAPLLRGEPCRDFAYLRENSPAYTPAVFVKSYYEICQHVKLGTKSFPWCSPEYGYPGGIAVGRKIMERLRPPPVEADLYWWFSMAEEWRGLDWERHEAEMCAMVVPTERESLVEEIRSRREFATWKFSLSAFCQRIWDVLAAEVKILTQHDVYGTKGQYLNELCSLEQVLAEQCLVPNEDLEIVTAALACRASAFVTNERAMLSQTALSVGLNCRTSFVHADRLLEALTEGFLFRYSERQVRPRTTDG